MAKTTVKDFRKTVKMMLDQRQKPVEMNPIDKMLEIARKQGMK